MRNLFEKFFRLFKKQQNMDFLFSIYLPDNQSMIVAADNIHEAVDKTGMDLIDIISVTCIARREGEGIYIPQ